jgi:SAM-dependent methyltransferase
MRRETVPQDDLNAHYAALVEAHGVAPAATQMSETGRLFRFRKLLEIAPLDDRDVLDLGCGTGALYPELVHRYPRARYTGADIVPAMLRVARRAHPGAHFERRDVLAQGLPGDWDFILCSALFNNARPDADAFREEVLRAAFAACRVGLGFNFISTHVTRRDPELTYADPLDVLRFCLEELSPYVSLHHCYERRDVCVFVYR